MPERFNIYDLPHKALRNILGELNLQFGNTNYRDEDQLKSLKDNFLKLMSLLASHSFIEDRQILDVLEAKGLTGLEQDKKDHERLDNMIFHMSSGLLEITSLDERAEEKGRILYMLFNQFNGEYLLHMHHEETETLNVVWENMTDEELLAVSQYVVDKTPPKILLDWYWYCLPAQTHSDRVAALRPILDKSAETLKATLTVVKKVLSKNEFKKVLTDLDLKIV